MAKKQVLQIERQLVQHLIELAMVGETTNYLEIAEQFGLPTEWPQLGAQVSPILYNVLEWCEQRRLPRLTVLVVRRSGEDKGIPGRGFWQAIGRPDLDRQEKRILAQHMAEEVYDFFKVKSKYLIGESVVEG